MRNRIKFIKNSLWVRSNRVSIEFANAKAVVSYSEIEIKFRFHLLPVLLQVSLQQATVRKKDISSCLSIAAQSLRDYL